MMESKGKIAVLMKLGMLILLAAGSFSKGVNAQKLAYSMPDKAENRQVNFEIIGQYGENYMIFKSLRGANYISLYNSKMELVKHEPITTMPEKIIDAKYVAYPDFCYLFYQFYRKGIVYCMAVKIGADGKSLTEPIELDTTATGPNSNVKVYQVLASENKEKLMVLKINNKNEQLLIFKTKLFDKELNLKYTSTNIGLEMSERYDFLTEFSLDNDGHLVFGKGIRMGMQDNITRFFLLVKPAAQNGFIVRELNFDKNFTLDEIKLKLDNFNNRYLFTGFYYQGRKTNIEGIANAIFDKSASEWVVRNAIPLGDELREDARGTNSTRNAFQDYFIKDIIVRSDGAFLLNAEALYQTNRGYNNNMNRWNMMNPMMGGMGGFGGMGGMGGMGGFGFNSPFGMGGMPTTGATRYNADNIMILAFDKNGKMILSNFVFKTQFDDNNENMVGHAAINTGNGIQYLYNDYSKKETMLSYQTLTTQGRVERNPYIKNLQRDYNFIPVFAKQVDRRVVIVPCLYRNLLCFARLEFPQEEEQ